MIWGEQSEVICGNVNVNKNLLCVKKCSKNVHTVIELFMNVCMCTHILVQCIHSLEINKAENENLQTTNKYSALIAQSENTATATATATATVTTTLRRLRLRLPRHCDGYGYGYHDIATATATVTTTLRRLRLRLPRHCDGYGYGCWPRLVYSAIWAVALPLWSAVINRLFCRIVWPNFFFIWGGTLKNWAYEIPGCERPRLLSRSRSRSWDIYFSNMGYLF